MSSTERLSGHSARGDAHAETHTEHDDHAGEPFAWSDPKRYLWLLGLIPAAGLFLSLPLVAGLAALGGDPLATAGWFLLPVLVFVVIPLADLTIGTDGHNPPEEVMDRLEADPFYRWCTYLYIPVQYAVLVLACYLWTADDLSWLGLSSGLGLVAKIAVAWSAGITGGIGINTAHELGHKIDDGEKWLSKIALATTAYGHFYIEHNRGHHARVATPEDPASSRLGESFWAFLPRSVVGSLRSAWSLERDRLHRRGGSHWSPANDVLNAWAMTVVLFAALTAGFGVEVLPWLLLQAVYGFSLLEAVNYLEHYGLLRQKTDLGRYQRCRPQHSWNSDHLVTNIFLYHLQRHSDHHANPMRRYQTLRTVDDAPQLPSGYAAMIVVAYVPWLWRRVMDPRVLAHYDGDVRRANIQPSRRERVLARYGAGGDATAGTGAGSTAVETAGPAEVTSGNDPDARPGAVSAAGLYACPNCGHHYAESAGEPREGFPAGTPWSAIPDDWQCPDCGVREKIDFLPVG